VVAVPFAFVSGGHWEQLRSPSPEPDHG
jgi:hypothetical protein